MTFVPDTSRVVRATGRASITTVPDVAMVTLGVRVTDADARRAKTSVDAIISKIVSLAKGLKVPDGDLRTAAVNIEPRSDPENPTRSRGYEVTRSITVVLKRLEDLDALLDGAVQAGANSDFDVELTSSRAEELRREATTQALADARAQANVAAEQLGVRVVGVRSIDLEGANRQGMVNASMASYATGVPTARFLPGLIRINVEIPVVFMIDDRR
jgi:uncharacterized protein YggE